MPIADNWILTPESTQIAGFGYNPETCVLTIQFSGSGAIYDYFDVPPAESKGRFFGQHIKGQFRYQKQGG